MATIFPRKNKDGTISAWRVLFRRRGMKLFCCSFYDREEAVEFVKKYEVIFCLDPDRFDWDKIKRQRMNEFQRKKIELIDEFYRKGEA